MRRRLRLSCLSVETSKAAASLDQPRTNPGEKNMSGVVSYCPGEHVATVHYSDEPKNKLQI